jgi:hypothetical protein
LLALVVLVGRETSSWCIIAQSLISEGRTGEGEMEWFYGLRKRNDWQWRNAQGKHVVWTRELDEAKRSEESQK